MLVTSKKHSSSIKIRNWERIISRLVDKETGTLKSKEVKE